ncbi:MAG: RpiB/LacA/LacB family sugar-phosphate isomerase, partial [Legionellales bacterium]|nr:RpiB/LacA/LacB family sugar-phosphate isomerase [Legionellales bacterium]
AETAKGAIKWNNANVLVMSLRLVSFPVAQEILKAWFEEEFMESNKQDLKILHEIEKKYSCI